MKQLLLITLFITAAFTAKAQHTGEDIAGRIAQRMKDTLSLSDPQRSQVYNINLQLHQQKAAVWQQYGSDTTALRQQLQLRENTRDSLYHGVLTEQQYQLYRQKKLALVHNN